MVGHGHIQRQQFKVNWAWTRGAVATAEKDERANIRDLRSWHEHQEVQVRLAKESVSRFVNGFITATGGPIMIREQETFSVLARLVRCDNPASLCRTREVDQETEHAAPPLWAGS